MKRELVKHEETKNSTYGFNLLNDKQRSSICGLIDFLHCAINKDSKSGKALLRNGVEIEFDLSMIGVINKI